MNKISIIIPAYNAEKTIERCINSVLEQTKSVYEIIIVNDGSKDNTEEKVKKYLENHNQIKYYYQENSGVAQTRNNGISKATGDYIIFIDSDDYIDKKLIEKISQYTEKNIDLIKYKLQRVDTKGKIIEKVEGPVFEEKTGEEAFNEMYYQDVLIDSPCVYAIKKELFTKNQFKFQGTYHEDFGLIPIIVSAASSVVSIPDYLYIYVQEGNSITRNESYSKTIKKMESALFQYDNMLKTIEKLNLQEITKQNIKIYYTNAIILKLTELKKEDRKKFIKEIKSRNMIKNIKPRNLKQGIKSIILKTSVNLYLKIR